MDELLKFPITGAAVCSELGECCEPNALWLLRDIETLSGEADAEPLGILWSKTSVAPVQITTHELCDALKLAAQVISLDIQLLENASVELWIDDGELVSDTLKSMR